MLLTYDQYTKLSGKVSEDKYEALEKDAEALFNAATNFFYVRNNIDEDTDTFRVDMFRKALALQIDYTNDIGASTTYEIADKSIKSVSIDGTSVTSDKSAAEDNKKGIYNLAWEYLLQTGLLYAGVPYEFRRW